jgi:hypothetical protein
MCAYLKWVAVKLSATIRVLSMNHGNIFTQCDEQVEQVDYIAC